MVALNRQKEVVGYMIWAIIGIRAEIDIVEVKADYRRQGICKKMLTSFPRKFTNISVLSASVLPQAEKVFTKADCEIKYGCNNAKKHIKIIKPGLQPLNTLPNGRVIAVCSQTEIDGYADYYTIKNNSKYKHLIKYFQIDLNENGSLITPIITDFHYEGYIGVYFNKKLIVDGKLRHLFSNDREMCDSGLNLLVMNKIQPLNSKLFNEKGFFPLPQRQSSSNFFLPPPLRIQEETHLPPVQQAQNRRTPVITVGEKRPRDHNEEAETPPEDQPSTKKRKIDYFNICTII